VTLIIITTYQRLLNENDSHSGGKKDVEKKQSTKLNAEVTSFLQLQKLAQQQSSVGASSSTCITSSSPAIIVSAATLLLWNQGSVVDHAEQLMFLSAGF